MSKRGLLKIGGFIGTLAGGAALVATAAGGTGAWFTDSSSGTITARAGSLTLNTTDTTINLTGIMPGEDRTSNVNYNVAASGGKVDVWVTFDQTSLAYLKFTGEKHNVAWDDGGLGRYGHFAVGSNTAGTVFNSYNLQNASENVSGCADANGHGSNLPPANYGDTTTYCGVPGAILVASNLSSGDSGTVNITFGLQGRQTQQNQLQANHVPYQIVATQHGHKPGDSNF